MFNEHYRYMRTYIQSVEAVAIDAARNSAMEKESYEEFVLWAHGRGREMEEFFDEESQTLGQACQSCEPAAPGLLPNGWQTLTEAALQNEDHFDLPDSDTAFQDRFSVLDAVPEDDDRTPIRLIHDGYNALNDVANKAGYDGVGELVEDQVDETAIAREYIRENYPDLSPQEEKVVLQRLREEGVIDGGRK